MNREDFIKKIVSMTLEDIRETIYNKGKGPKPSQLVCRMESDAGNNIQTTKM